ncbi:30S ribosomal protein S12 methylthiotransferase RimO [Atopobiaceae bacterium 24-176]
MDKTISTAERKPRILFVTLGCAKNEVDTDRMRSLLVGASFAEADDVADADAVIVNTCSFLASATSESIEATLELAEERAAGARELPIVMCGCVPSRYGDDLPSELPEVAAFVRTDEEDGIVGVMERVLGVSAAPGQGEGPLRTVQGASAYVKISDGCNRFCSFCAIPYIRGRYASRPATEILEEVTAQLEGGTREIVLIGQDTGIWGTDFAEPQSLADLLNLLAPVAAAHNAWIRVLYLQPEGMTPELVAAIRDNEAVLPYIDIPIQHASGAVLSAMNRTGDAEQLAEVFARLREEIPSMVLRTTGMAGFPGETEEDFELLCDFLEDEGFDYVSVFAYSPEEGTAACSYKDQVPDDVKLERTQRLIDIAETLGFAATASHVGETVDVIIDGVEDDGDGNPEFIGHAWFQAPDCDGAVHIASGDYAVGDVVTVRLVDAFCYELVGEPVEGDGQ